MKRFSAVVLAIALATLTANSWAVTAKVCIDPAGGNPEMSGPWLTCDQNALYVGLKFRDWLNKDTNDTAGGGSWTVIMTRTSQTNPTLQARVDLANNNGCTRYMRVSIVMQETPASGGYTMAKPTADSVALDLRNKVSARMNWAWPGIVNTVGLRDWFELTHVNMPAESCMVGYYPGVDAAYTGYTAKLEEAGIAHMYALQENCGLAAYNPSNVPTIVADNTSTAFSASANWATGTASTDKYGTNYRFRSTAPVSDTANWNPSIATAGTYSVYAWWPQGTNRSRSALYILPDNENIYVNQQTNGGRWNRLGTKSFSTGAKLTRLSCWVPTGYVVIADAIKYAK